MALLPRTTLLVVISFGLIGSGASARPAAAQTGPTSADVVGVVQDQVGGVLPGATVAATNLATQNTRTAVTDREGRFALLALPVGTYDVSISFPGFATHTVKGTTLALGARVQLDVVLQLATLAGGVVDVSAPLNFETHRTAVSSVISRHHIEQLPINVRNFIEFSALTPGVSRDFTPHTGGAAATSGLTFLGQRARSNNITVDGLDNNDLVVGSVRATFSQEAVREFDVLTNGFTAEFGKAAGGVVNIVTKSGTNVPSGNAFYFHRDKALNARNYFESHTPAGDRIELPKAPFGQQQFGGTFGGPLKRDRSFFFVSFERLNIDTNNFVAIDNETPVAVFGQPAGTVVQLLQSAGFPVQTGHVGYDVRSTTFLAKLDHRPGTNNSLAARFNWADDLDENIEPWGGITARSGGASIGSRDYMAAVSHTRVPTSRIVNELRAQVAHRNQDVRSLDPTCPGICDVDDEGGPGVEIIGVAVVGRHRFTPQQRQNLRIQLQDTLTYFKGSHQFKFGVDYSYIDHQRQSLPLHFGGRYIFAPLPAIPGVLPVPVTAAEAFALGLPLAYVQGFGDPSGPFSYSDLSLFAQTEWSVGRRLTLKAGLRYQIQFWPDVTTVVPGYGDHRFEIDSNNLAPRVAVAWDPWGGSRTAVHAAYGVYYDNNLTSYAGINEVLDGGDGVRTLVLPFPFSVQGWLAPGRRLPEAFFAGVPSVVFAVGPGTVTPYAHHANVGIDHELGLGLTVGAAVIYGRGVDHIAVLDFNPFLPDLGPFRRPLDIVDPRTGLGVAGSSTSVLQSTSWGETWYKGVALTLAKRLTGRYDFAASYTLADAEDTATDFTSAFLPDYVGRGRNPADPAGLPIDFDPNRERGPSLQHHRHTFVVRGTVVLPGGAQLAAIVSAASGRPFDILAGADLNGDGDGGGPPSDRARRDPADPATAVGRNAGRMPATATASLRVSRRFLVGSRARIEPIVEVFNLFNRTNFTGVNNIFGVDPYPASPLPAFGQFLQAGPPRQLQLAVKIGF